MRVCCLPAVSWLAPQWCLAKGFSMSASDRASAAHASPARKTIFCFFYIRGGQCPFCMKESFVAIHCLVIPSPFSPEVSRVLSTSVHMRKSGLSSENFTAMLGRHVWQIIQYIQTYGKLGRRPDKWTRRALIGKQLKCKKRNQCLATKSRSKVPLLWTPPARCSTLVVDLLLCCADNDKTHSS